MVWTAPGTWVVGQVSTASDWNTFVAGNTQFLATPPMCRVYRNGGLVTGAQNPTQYDVKSFDSTSSFSTSTHLYTCPVAGTYHTIAAWSVDVINDGDWLKVGINRNGSEFSHKQGPPAGAASEQCNEQCVDNVGPCAASDTISGFWAAIGNRTVDNGPNQSYIDILKVSN